LTQTSRPWPAALAATSFLVGFQPRADFAIAQTVARPSMRRWRRRYPVDATCFGQGVGPLAVGMINDALKNDYGAMRALFAAVGRDHHTLGALLFVWAAASIRTDIKRRRPWPKQVAVNRMIADASARMLGRATVCAMAKIGPRWKPTRNEVAARAAGHGREVWRQHAHREYGSGEAGCDRRRP